MTTLKRPKVDRDQFRTQVIPREIRGLLSRPDRHSHLPFLIWDVSDTGIGIWATESLPLHGTVCLTIGQPYLLTVECEVVWCEEQKSSQGYRCGLRAISPAGAFQSFIDKLT